MTHFSHLTNRETRSIEVEQFSFRDRSGVKLIFDNIDASVHFLCAKIPSLITLTTLRSWDFYSCAADEDGARSSKCPKPQLF